MLLRPPQHKQASGRQCCWVLFAPAETKEGLLIKTFDRELKNVNEPPKLQESTFQYVASADELASMLDDLEEQLKTAPCLAMDLEHHHKHSYLGFTCLLQLSTGILFCSRRLETVPISKQGRRCSTCRFLYSVGLHLVCTILLLWSLVPCRPILMSLLILMHAASLAQAMLAEHAKRSFSNTPFVMQLEISVGIHDYVIDAIALHDELPQLNKILSNPAILKVCSPLFTGSFF